MPGPAPPMPPPMPPPPPPPLIPPTAGVKEDGIPPKERDKGAVTSDGGGPAKGSVFDGEVDNLSIGGALGIIVIKEAGLVDAAAE
eukprot:CAMPEP_0175040264 /NCGR_PEP_ID=MMETSP0052_2-20121109/1153_1 /TAXON_ID=51329 ORGANISM="Polytomella parva, Strain SAG 63-3" /NCGR_SAMPLE_ID=MMETSP0052_2 /ASSEMBLY_ACC=CAM_ASM_000194 /LENGTH=84 /DNA_ID=CAMNT_0016302429 /DNA_START=63 /DNA_END=317 /DNA_ORIENTATION=-